VVPNVVGDLLAQARAKIRQHHCSVGTITRKFSSRRLRNHVLSQSPKPGRRLANGHRVNLRVGKGPHHH
jgi:beta-lactam-binding protein with PASTA domain